MGSAIKALRQPGEGQARPQVLMWPKFPEGDKKGSANLAVLDE